MQRITSQLVLAAALLASCTSVGSSNNPVAEVDVEELAAIADRALACLQDHSVVDPKVRYDVVKTDSLINPVLGLVEVEFRETIATLPGGTPVVTVNNKYQLSFTYQDGDWLPKDLEVVQGQTPEDTDPVNVCFRQ